MANYVHNYLFCSETAKDRMMNLTDDDYSLLSGCYDKTVTPTNGNRFLVLFDTRGMEYCEDFIKGFIQEHKDTKWYCIEENEIEQGFYFWDGSEVAFNKRELIDSLDSKEIRIRYEDSEFRPFCCIFISDRIIVFEKFLENEMRRYSLSEKSKVKINDYLDSILSEKAGEFDAVPIKDGIGREIDIHWEDQTYFIDHVDEDDNRVPDVKDGETRFEEITSFFNSILADEDINESVSFELKDALNRTEK